MMILSYHETVGSFRTGIIIIIIINVSEYLCVKLLCMYYSI